MKKKEQDRRILKTRQAIQEALFSLMLEKQYSKITIQDIIDRANVGRSTFYSHFTEKDELLISNIEHILKMLNSYIVSFIESTGDKSKVISIIELFEHVKQNSRIIKGLFKSESSDLFFDKAQAYCNDGIEQYLSSKLNKEDKTKVPIAILTNHISSSSLCLLKWWVMNDMPYSPLQMDKYFQELISPCIQNSLSEL